jgi:hypothetical protein
VNISTNWPLFSSMVSQKMVSDVYVFGSRILTRVVSNLDDTLIVT